MQFTCFCDNQCSSPYIGTIATQDFLNSNFHLDEYYLIYGVNRLHLVISIIPTDILNSGDILLPSILMEALGVMHGGIIRIENIVQSELPSKILSVSISLRNSVHHSPLPLSQLSRLEQSYSFSESIQLLYRNKPLSLDSRVLFPVLSSWLIGDIESINPSEGTLIDASSSIQFTIIPPKIGNDYFRVPSTVSQYLQALQYSIGQHTLGNEITKISGIAIIGGPGSGKSSLLRYFCREVNQEDDLKGRSKSALFLSSSEFPFSDPFSILESMSSLQVLCVDDVDDLSEGILKLIGVCFKKKIIVILAIPKKEVIPEFLLKEGYFDASISLHAPTQIDRFAILSYLLGARVSGASIKYVSENTSGFSYRDLNSVSRLMTMKNMELCVTREGEVKESEGEMSEEKVREIVRSFSPSSLLGLDVRKSSLSLEDFGGYNQAKTQLVNLLSLVNQQPHQLKRFNLTPATGILVYGPTGCGKSTLIPAVIGELGGYYIYVECPALFSKYFSETEANIRRVFALARSVAPCIIVFDQLEVLAGRRNLGGGGGDGGLNERIVTTLLTELDGVDGTNGGVTTVGLVNDEKLLDDAVIRPGRLGTHVFIGKPSKDDREAILRVITRKMPVDESVDYANIGERTEGMSGAEIRFLCTEAGLLAMRDLTNSTRTIQQHHFSSILNSRQ